MSDCEVPLCKPLRCKHGAYVECSPEDADHLRLNFPGPAGTLILPVILKGPRKDTGSWTWNGSIGSPTLRPSVRTRGADYVCHSWVTDGSVNFLGDTTHSLAGQLVPLLPIDESPYGE